MDTLNRGSVGLGLATHHISIANNQDRKVGKVSFSLLILSFIILLSNILSSDLNSSIRHTIFDHTVIITDAVQGPINHVTATIERLKTMWDMTSHNEMVMAENKRLMEWYQTANRLNEENKALRELLNVKEEEAVSKISALVMTDVNTHYSNTILVRSGEKQGLNKGQGVLSHEGLIGRVIETGENTSRVLLLSDINSRIPVTIESSQERAILAGANEAHPFLDHLPESHQVVAGQKVITSGHGGIFPYGVPVGETYMADNGKIAVKPYAQPNRASFVQIVDYGVPAGSTTRATASNGSSVLR